MAVNATCRKQFKEKMADHKWLKSLAKISLQNRRISGSSAIYERAREARARTRSARHEISACKHTIV